METCFQRKCMINGNSNSWSSLVRAVALCPSPSLTSILVASGSKNVVYKNLIPKHVPAFQMFSRMIKMIFPYISLKKKQLSKAFHPSTWGFSPVGSPRASHGVTSAPCLMAAEVRILLFFSNDTPSLVWNISKIYGKQTSQTMIV